MNLKQRLCDVVVSIKSDNKLTYADIVKKTDGLVNDTQINNILRHGGREITSDRIYNVIYKLGYRLNIEIE